MKALALNYSNNLFLSAVKKYYFWVVCILFALITFLTQSFVQTDDLYYSFYSEQLSSLRINQIVSFRKEWQWVLYLVIPIIFALKFFLISCCLSVGLILANKKIAFKQLFYLITLAETPFLVAAFLKFFWFLLIETHYTLADLYYFSPLSLLNMFDIANLDKMWLYPLQTLNFFEVCYMLLLAWLLKSIFPEDYNDRLQLVMTTYLPGLFLWIIGAMFIQITLGL